MFPQIRLLFLISFISFLSLISAKEKAEETDSRWHDERRSSEERDVNIRKLQQRPFPLRRQSNSNSSRHRNIDGSWSSLYSFADYREVHVSSPFQPVYTPCELLLEEFTGVAINFTKCVTGRSLPPQVCTRCADDFMALEKAFFVLKDSSEVKISDGRSCDQVIFSEYDTAYVEDVYDVLTNDIWANSRCGDCLEFIVEPTVAASSSDDSVQLHRTPSRYYRYNNKTVQVLDLYETLFRCFHNASGTNNDEELKRKNASIVCGNCWKEYENLNVYYEESIMAKRDFCVDIDSLINDTIHLWRKVLECPLPQLPSKQSEAVFVALISLIMFAVTSLFYAGSFMQGTRKKRRLKKYRSRYQFGAINITHDAIIEEYMDDDSRRQSTTDRVPLLSSRSEVTERTPLFAQGRRIMSYSQLPPSNLG